MDKKTTSFRLTIEVQRLLAEMSKEQGIPRAAILEIAVRQLYKRTQRENRR